MKQPLNVLGINSAHDASACLLCDGNLVVAIAEERLSRVKHHAGFPHRAVAYCLGASGLESLNAVDCVVLNQPPSKDFDLELRQRGYEGQLMTNPSHHLLHAYYAWIASGFNEAAILIVDGSGYSYGEYLRRSSPLLGDPPPYSEMEEAESFYLIRDQRIELVGKRWALWEGSAKYCRFASLGHMFSMASQYIFGHWGHAGKVMGLAPYGDPTSFSEPFVELVEPEIVVNTQWPIALPPRSSAPADLDPVCRDLAAKVQSELERAMLHLAKRLSRQTGLRRLLISGGVGLNSVANGRILRELPSTELFVTPAAGDSGICIGAALYGHHFIQRQVPHWRYRNDFHGRRYHKAEITAAVRRRERRLRVEELGKGASARAARDIADGLIIGWFEGGSEFGPRALGHRSILCDPRSPAMPERLNETVKFRETFRPFAASVLAERAHDFFDMSGEEDPFMLLVMAVLPECLERIPAICHVDGTCRVQTVRVGHQGRFRDLIEAFMDLTGVPLVLNTSFNVRGEPMVETPGDAMDCFLASNIDVLYIDGHRITKASVRAANRPGDLIPVLNKGLSLHTIACCRDGRVLEPEHHVETRTGYRASVAADELALLRAIDGNRTISEIKDILQGEVSTDPLSGFADLQSRGLVSFALLPEQT